MCDAVERKPSNSTERHLCRNEHFASWAACQNVAGLREKNADPAATHAAENVATASMRSARELYCDTVSLTLTTLETLQFLTTVHG